MNRRQITGTLIALVLAAVPLAGSPVQAGLFDGLCSWWQPPAAAPLAPAPTYTVQRVAYMPVTTVAYSVPTAQTCYYQPETRYRWVYSRIPRTSYRPVASVDPCTGTVTTTYRPVTQLSLLPWLHREPYTTYRYTCTPSYASCYTPACSSTTICDPCSSCGTSVIGSSGSACSSCAPSVTTTTPSPAPGGTAPSLQNNYNPPSTFRSEPSGTQSQQRFKPETQPEPGNTEKNTSMPRLRLIPPTEQTAARPLQMAGRPAIVPYVKPIPWNAPAARATSYQAPSPVPASTQPELDVSGWHSVAP